MREDICLQTIGEQIGQVISIDNSKAYRAKLFGPRIRLLVKDLDDLPLSVILPRLDGKGTIEYAVEFSGLPNQCGRCRSREHQVRYCPKKEVTSQYKPHQRPPPKRPDPPTRQIALSSPQRPTEIPLPIVQDTTEEPLEEQSREIPQLQTQEEEQVVVPTLSPAQTPEDTKITIPVDTENPTQPNTEKEPTETNLHRTLQADDLNFPKLPSSAQKTNHREDQTNMHQPISTTEATHFVWRKMPSSDTTEQETAKAGGDKGKGKQVSKTPESAPITRQGYRTGRLADDF